MARNDNPTQLDDVLSDIRRRLCEGMSDRNSALHAPVIATADADARVMVLREFDPERWTLRFHTDIRAPKTGVIARDPRVGVLAYDKPGKLQLRMTGAARIETEGAVADRAWESSANFARRCYLGEGPGTPSDEPTSGLPERFEGTEPDDAELVPARPNFAVMLVTLETLDWFHLAHDGHRRARFDRHGADWRGQWIAP